MKAPLPVLKDEYPSPKSAGPGASSLALFHKSGLLLLPIFAFPAPFNLAEDSYCPGPGVRLVYDLYFEPNPALPLFPNVEVLYKYPPGPG